MYDAVDDPYTYENSTVLIKSSTCAIKPNLMISKPTFQVCANEPLPEGNLDFARYSAIHRHLFQDVYEWAGRPRTVRI